jgi:general secretion pathway protein H
MVVVLIVAVASGMISLSLRDRSQSRLETEGARLSALLETARTQSRIIGTDVSWQPVATGGFEFDGLPPAASKELPRHWLDNDTTATIVGAKALKLGPEPLLPAQRVVLHLGERELAIGTDGLTPFQIIDTTTPVAAQ